MREIPMMYSTPMVQGLLTERKNQTRRINDGKLLFPGDRIWVRETTAFVGELLIYKADLSPAEIKIISDSGVKWKPSIFMKKEHARIHLEITDFRVEPLHEITEEDAINEGIEFTELGWRNYLKKVPDFGFVNPVDSFESLWKSINGAESWEANPIVKRIQFEKI